MPACLRLSESSSGETSLSQLCEPRGSTRSRRSAASMASRKERPVRLMVENTAKPPGWEEGGGVRGRVIKYFN